MAFLKKIIYYKYCWEYGGKKEQLYIIDENEIDIANLENCTELPQKKRRTTKWSSWSYIQMINTKWSMLVI